MLLSNSAVFINKFKANQIIFINFYAMENSKEFQSPPLIFGTYAGPIKGQDPLEKH